MSGTMRETRLYSKVRGCLYGGAIGDALGAPTEGRTPEAIQARYGEVQDFVEPWDGPSHIGKGDGRYTDDTHMVRLLSEVYCEEGRYLDVYDFARIVPERIGSEPRWISEFGREAPLLERLFHPEKWLYVRHCLANADPRMGGHGNMVNCGAAMYASPVGIVNFCQENKAYADGVDIFSAHQWSYGLEAAGLMAFAVACAFHDLELDELLARVTQKAHEGTHGAIRSVRRAAQVCDDWRPALPAIREAMRPHDGAPDDFRDRGNRTDDWTPSRERSIEELPVALAIMEVCQGDFRNTVLAAANYGRDCDSTAGMAGAILGALHGCEAIPADWIETVNEANRMNLDPLAEDLSELACRLAWDLFHDHSPLTALDDHLS